MIKTESIYQPRAAATASSPTTPLARAWLSLEGLSVGDAFGEQAFGTALHQENQRHDTNSTARWPWTDDTAMAMAIVEVLERFGAVHQDELAAIFARNYGREPARGYGAGAHRILTAIGEGTPWRVAAQTAFGGAGSCGNGGGMRAAPLGAYFCDDLERVVAQARLSAEPTHLHLDGIAGAIGIAVTAAMVFAGERSAATIVATATSHMPEGETKRQMQRLVGLPDWRSADVMTVAAEVGNGSNVRSSDTVPFAIWCATRFIDDYQAACHACWHVGGDVDTTCAMVGGIVVGAVGFAGIPTAWRAMREPLPIATGFGPRP
ncbi:MAG: ADP-ribosylglycohydrolase family protein [Kofleriaceae bacterium]|nr:ADP-ribosylglycohydrolase family protein [Kofleriaceae bacterium]